MNRKGLVIIFLLCVIFGCMLVLVGGVTLATQRWIGIAMISAGLGLLLLAYPVQNAFLKKQWGEVIASLDNLGNTSMSLERFCKIAEALSNSDTVIDCTLGDAITWEDVFFAIDEHDDDVSQETEIAGDELRQWKKEAILNHAEYYPFTAEQA